MRAAIAAKTQSLGGDLAEDHGLYMLVEDPSRKISRGSAPRGSAARASWAPSKGRRVVGQGHINLSRGELACFEKPNDWMVSTSARGRLSVTKDTSVIATENEDGAYFRGPAGAPTPHTLSVNDEWTAAFEDARALTAWRDALEKRRRHHLHQHRPSSS